MQAKYFRLLDSADKVIGDFSSDDIRSEVEKIAQGKDWGWREGAAGQMDAVCEYVVIAQAVPLSV